MPVLKRIGHVAVRALALGVALGFVVLVMVNACAHDPPRVDATSVRPTVVTPSSAQPASQAIPDNLANTDKPVNPTNPENPDNPANLVPTPIVAEPPPLPVEDPRFLPATKAGPVWIPPAQKAPRKPVVPTTQAMQRQSPSPPPDTRQAP